MTAFTEESIPVDETGAPNLHGYFVKKISDDGLRSIVAQEFGVSTETAAELADEVLTLRAALTQPPSPVAAGEYVLVPVEPTPAMLGAWYRYKNGHHFPDEPAPEDTSDYGAYRAMLSARPPIGETVPGAGWQQIETLPHDGKSVALWVEPKEPTDPAAHVFSPVSITTEGDWWDDSTGDQIEPIIGATYWMRPAPPIVSTQEGEAPHV